MGGGIWTSCDEEHSELVAGGVAVASGGASAQLDDSVDGFGAVRCLLRRYRSRRLVRPSTCVGFAPRRAISGMGQAGRRWMRRAARRRPWAGMAWWKTSRTCPVKVGDVDTDMRLICYEGITEAFFLSLEGIHRHDLDTGAKLFAALF